MFQFSLLFLLTRDTERMAELINEKIDKRSFGVQILEEKLNLRSFLKIETWKSKNLFKSRHYLPQKM